MSDKPTPESWYILGDEFRNKEVPGKPGYYYMRHVYFEDNDVNSPMLINQFVEAMIEGVGDIDLLDVGSPVIPVRCADCGRVKTDDICNSCVRDRNRDMSQTPPERTKPRPSTSFGTSDGRGRHIERDEWGDVIHDPTPNIIMRAILSFTDWLNNRTGVTEKPKEKANGEQMATLDELFEGYEVGVDWGVDNDYTVIEAQRQPSKTPHTIG